MVSALIGDALAKALAECRNTFHMPTAEDVGLLVSPRDRNGSISSAMVQDAAAALRNHPMPGRRLLVVRARVARDRLCDHVAAAVSSLEPTLALVAPQDGAASVNQAGYSVALHDATGVAQAVLQVASLAPHAMSGTRKIGTQAHRVSFSSLLELMHRTTVSHIVAPPPVVSVRFIEGAAES